MERIEEEEVEMEGGRILGQAIEGCSTAEKHSSVATEL